MAYEQEKIKPYGAEGAKTELVEQMFDNIAPTYDRLNHRLSWNIDKQWRRKAILELADFHPQRILDVATGTGDFAILATQMLNPASLIGADISEGMMEIGRRKVADMSLDGTISFAREDCLDLSFDDSSFDAVISAFGIRNFQDLDKGLAECCRVLRPGGMLSVVELTTPIRFPMKQLFAIYSKVVLPAWGKIVSGDKGAYEYLNRSIAAFPQGEVMRQSLLKAGFREARFQRMTCGICTRYVAVK